MIARQLLFPLLLIALLWCGGCNQKLGPKHTLHFVATPLPGAKSAQIDLASAQRIVRGRVRGTGVRKQLEVTTSGLNQVIVTIYGAEQTELDKIEEYITAPGTMELAAIAHRDVDIELVEQAEKEEREVRVDGVVVAEWVPASRLPNGDLKMGPVQPSALSRERDVDGRPVSELLIVYVPGQRIKGSMLTSASESMDQVGAPCIDFAFNAEGAANLLSLTTSLTPRGTLTRQLAIIFDGRIQSAPTVQSSIKDRGQITGNFSQAEVRMTVQLLRAGTLPCNLSLQKVTKEDPPTEG